MKISYEIKIRLKSALHINAGIDHGVRLPVKNDNEAYIPATALKGILRSKMEMLVKALYPDYTCNGKENVQASCDCIMCRFFGKAGYQPSRIVIDNLYSEDGGTESEYRSNIGINRYTRQAQDKTIVCSETVSAAGEPVFRGNMIVYYTDEMIKYKSLLLKAFSMIDSIGSGKSRGSGFVETEVAEL